MSVTIESDEKLVDVYKKSWDAFLDAYQKIVREKKQREELLDFVVEGLSNKQRLDADAKKVIATYEEITGKKVERKKKNGTS